MSFPSKTKLLVLLLCSVVVSLVLCRSNVRAQAVNLSALGIDVGFELPDLGGNDGGEQVNLVGFGPGWSFTELGGEITDWGVQDPGVDFFARVADTPDNDDLAAPFEGRQIGFVNLNTTLASAELVSLSVGKLQASTNYSLAVAVGIRQNQAAWTVDYEIGLRTLGGTDLGTFATINKTNLTLPEDLVYDLNVGAAHPNIGEEVSIVVRSTNAAGDAFSQSAFDNVRLQGTFGAANTPFLTINRGTGAVSLSKTGTDNLSILGYSLTSEAGSLNGSNWTEIGGAWSVTSNTADDLSEVELTGGAPVTLSSATPRNFGTPWRRTPFEDVTAELLLSDGSLMPVVVQYTGAEIPFGDLTGDGSISVADWTAFKSGQGSSFAGLLDAQAYLLGDLELDGDHDLGDFLTFRTAYDDFNGLGAFAAMAAAVPEPGAFAMLGCAIAAASFVRKKRGLGGHRPPCVAPSHSIMGTAGAMVLLVTAQSASGQVIGPIPIPNFSFQEPVIPTDGNPDDEDPFDTDPGSPLGWTYSYTASPPGTESYGLQRPDPQSHFTRDVTGGETSPFDAPFDGDQIGFINLNNDGTTAAQVDSGVLGQLLAGTYTLNFAVGGRNTGSWRNLDYTIGLVGSTTGVLGTPTAQQIDPGNAAGNLPFYEPATDGFNVVDVEYTFTVPNGSPLIGEDVFIRLTVANTGLSGTGGFTQAAFDNSRLTGPTVPQFGLYVDPMSGQMQLRNPTGSGVALSSYRITSGSESLVESGWKPIASQGVASLPQGDGSGNGWEAGPQNDDGELVEWYLDGDSTIPGGNFIDLGLAYDAAQDEQDLSFQYTRPDGTLVSGLVYYSTIVPGDFDFDDDVDSADLSIWQSDYGQFRGGRDFLTWQRNFGTGVPLTASSVAVPEPSAVYSLLGGLVGLVMRNHSSRRKGGEMTERPHWAWMPCLITVVALCWTQMATAAVTIDRNYQFGDDVAEGATAPGTVGAGNTFGTTFDSSNVAGFRDLVPEASPGYVDVGTTGLGRPGAAAGAKGIELNGSNYLRGLRFNDPETAPGSIAAGGTQDYAGITNRGFQLWVLPSQTGLDGTVDQFVVHDTTEHGLKIDGDNSWIMIYDGGEHDSGVAATATWTHVMVVRPYSGQNNIGGSLLYVNGIAIEGEGGPYDVTPEPAGEAEYVLTIGTDSGNGQSDLISDANQLFSGVVDDLTLFAAGKTTNGIDLGTFNFGTDNGWAQMHLTGIAGDVDQDGSLDPIADVNALVAGWGSEKIVDGLYAGDMTTILNGDLNFDGRTNLADAFQLHQALLTAGFTAGLDFSRVQNISVPEPTTLALAGLLLAGCVSGRRRR